MLCQNTGFEILVNMQTSEDENNNNNQTNSTIVTSSPKNKDEDGF